ncbi:hypothetical protein ACTWQB_16965 [Piscibacillus sp. B03]|uniref:hypothetical protein n=1 Tax=Piscibacillus sp. B03 TaxID=3457430 RepID=UPI003FCCF5CE
MHLIMKLVAFIKKAPIIFRVLLSYVAKGLNWLVKGLKLSVKVLWIVFKWLFQGRGDLRKVDLKQLQNDLLRYDAWLIIKYREGITIIMVILSVLVAIFLLFISIYSLIDLLLYQFLPNRNETFLTGIIDALESNEYFDWKIIFPIWALCFTIGTFFFNFVGKIGEVTKEAIRDQLDYR